MEEEEKVRFSAVVKANTFRRENKDDAVMLFCIAGEIPNKNVIAWQIADSLGIEIAKKYEVRIVEKNSSEFGREFTWYNVGEWTGTALEAEKEYGLPRVVNVKSGFDSIG